MSHVAVASLVQWRCTVPLVAIFTKFDALDDTAYQELADEGLCHDCAVEQAPIRAVTDFETEYLPIVNSQRYPPKGHVYLRGARFHLFSHALVVNPVVSRHEQAGYRLPYADRKNRRSS